MPGCILETVFTGFDIYTLPSHALVHQLPRQFVDPPSPEVFKNRTNYPSVQNGFDVVLLIGRKRARFFCQGLFQS